MPTPQAQHQQQQPTQPQMQYQQTQQSVSSQPQPQFQHQDQYRPVPGPQFQSQPQQSPQPQSQPQQQVQQQPSFEDNSPSIASYAYSAPPPGTLFTKPGQTPLQVQSQTQRISSPISPIAADSSIGNGISVVHSGPYNYQQQSQQLGQKQRPSSAAGDRFSSIGHVQYAAIPVQYTSSSSNSGHGSGTPGPSAPSFGGASGSSPYYGASSGPGYPSQPQSSQQIPSSPIQQIATQTTQDSVTAPLNIPSSVPASSPLTAADELYPPRSMSIDSSAGTITGASPVIPDYAQLPTVYESIPVSTGGDGRGRGSIGGDGRGRGSIGGGSVTSSPVMQPNVHLSNSGSPIQRRGSGNVAPPVNLIDL
ncbi:unnamed protein product [Ambrosiozyma monospora]|uniref:Unnamed protein product n=1 Tax=Ambrosiozyma monospora TaxID=43982 RepID=A0A9W6YZH6_AMBMO|nr:unnamed protein product [Ambrosiozyma monospora]